MGQMITGVCIVEVPRRIRTRRGGRDKGASAVEFALVMPLLFLLLFGIIDYGLWFNDSLSLRQGVREAARQAVVESPKSPDACAVASFSMDTVACETKAQIRIGLPGAVAYAKVFVATPAFVASSSWVRGNSVVVCGMSKATSFTGFVPTPSGGLIKSRTMMSIEDATLTPATTSYTADVDPSGGNWSWCTTP